MVSSSEPDEKPGEVSDVAMGDGQASKVCGADVEAGVSCDDFPEV